MNLPGLLGVILVLHDFNDIGKIDRFHHYMLGLILMVVSS
jgi:hypothetical protein